MSKNIRKSLCICAATLLLGGIVAPSISNYSVSAHRRHHITRVRKYHRSRKNHKARKNKISYRTYKYNLRKYNQYQRNLKKARRSFNYYKKLLRHKHSRRLMRKYTNSKRYWQKQINQLTKGSYRYQRVVKQYKNGNSFKIIIKYPHKNTRRSREYKPSHKYKIYNEAPSKIRKPKAHKLRVRHHSNHHVRHNLANSTHKYVLDTSDMVDNNSLNNIQNDKGYQYGGGSIGDLVHIINQKQIDGNTFDYIKDPNDSYDNNKWIYDGELSDNPNDTASNISLENLEKDIHSNYINDNYQTFLQQMKRKSLSFINNARENYGRNPVIEDPTMDQLANLRANQLISRYSHYTPDGQSYAEVDAPQFNISMNPGWGENIAWNYVTPRGYEETDPTTYNESNGNGMAYAANNNMLNWDSHSNWGHKKNMLNPNSDLIGIGSAYDPNTQKFFLAEDFYNNPTIIPYNNTTNDTTTNTTYNYNNNNNDDNDQPINDNNDNGNGDNAGGNGTQAGGNGTQAGSPANNPNNSSNPNNSYNGNNSNDSDNNDTNSDINNYGYSDGNNNTILSTSDGAVIDHGSNNTINAKGSVIVDGYNNTINSRGIVIANGYNNTVNAKKTIWNDTNTNDNNYQEALVNGVAINASNMNGQNISK